MMDERDQKMRDKQTQQELASLEEIFTGIKKTVTLKLVAARVEMLFELMTGMQNEIDLLADRTNVLAVRIKEGK